MCATRGSTLFERAMADIRLAHDAETDAEAEAHLERAFARIDRLRDDGEKLIAWTDATSLAMRVGVRRVA